MRVTLATKLMRNAFRPICGPFALMSDSDDEQPLLIHDVHETVRKAHQHFRSHTVGDYRRDLRIFLDVSRR